MRGRPNYGGIRLVSDAEARRRDKEYKKTLKKKNMPRKKATKKKRASHNPSLKARMKHSGTRLVHGYETTRRKSKRRK